MLDLAGHALTWIAYVAIIPIMAAPLAAMLAGKFARNGRMGGALIWFALSVGVVAAAILFSELAVDLPGFQPGAVYLIWLGAVAMLTFGAGLLVGLENIIIILSRLFERAARLAGRGAMWFVIIMALIQFVVVILRYVFGVNFIWMQESITYLHGALFLLAGGYALITGDHVRVDIFYRDAPPRRKALVDFLGTYCFLFPFCLLILWSSAAYVGAAWGVREGSTEQSGIQGVYLLKTLIPLFAIFLSMAGFVIAARAAQSLHAAPEREAA